MELEDDMPDMTATEYAEVVKQELENNKHLGIVEVEVFTDLSKEETIETFRRIKEDSIKYTEENNCKLGLFCVDIGFQLTKNNSELLD